MIRLSKYLSGQDSDFIYFRKHYMEAQYLCEFYKIPFSFSSYFLCVSKAKALFLLWELWTFVVLWRTYGLIIE